MLRYLVPLKSSPWNWADREVVPAHVLQALEIGESRREPDRQSLAPLLWITLPLTELPGGLLCWMRTNGARQAPTLLPLSGKPFLLPHVPYHLATGVVFSFPSPHPSIGLACKVLLSLPPLDFELHGDRDCVYFAHRRRLAVIGCINEPQYSSFPEP